MANKPECSSRYEASHRVCCRRRNRSGHISFTAFAALSVASAFQTRVPLSSSQRVRTHQHVALDPDILLRDFQRPSDPSIEKLEELFRLSAAGEHDFLAPVAWEEVSQSTTKKEPVKFRGLSTTASRKPRDFASMDVQDFQPKKVRTKSTTARTKSRSSTMPGFSAKSERQRAHVESIRLVERHTGRKHVETVESKKQRRKINGENMYKTSASVPDSLVQFAGEIHQEERISRSEEIELGEKTQEAIRLQNLFDVLQAKLHREPTDEEWCAAAGKINMEAVRQAMEEGLDAKNKLVTSNLRMVQSVVNTYIRNGLTAQYNAGDMMQEGIIALIRAAEKFEPERGWKFSTYAMYWVRASVKRSQLSQSRIISVPQRMHETHKRLCKIEKQFEASMGRKPSRSELALAAGVSESQVERCTTAMKQKCYSLDQEIANTRKPMNDSRRDTLIDLIESKGEDKEYKRLQMTMLREDLIQTLHRHLEPEEVELLLLRYGLKDGPNAIRSGQQSTIAELSRTMGMKPDKVRRTINRSLKRLKTVGMEEWVSFQNEL